MRAGSTSDPIATRASRVLRVLAVPFVILVLAMGAFIGVTLIDAFIDAQRNRRVVRAKEDLASLVAACMSFEGFHGRWPAGLHELLGPPPLADGSVPPPYLTKVPRDPWSEIPYEATFTAGAAPTFRSLGADGAPGGTGRDADITVAPP